MPWRERENDYCVPPEHIKFVCQMKTGSKSSSTGLAFSTAGQRQAILLFTLLLFDVPLGKLLWGNWFFFWLNIAAEK